MSGYLFDLSNQCKYSEILEYNIPDNICIEDKFMCHYYRYIAGYYLNNSIVVIDAIESMRLLLKQEVKVREYYSSIRSSIDSNMIYAKKYMEDIRLLQLTHAVLIPCYKPHLKKLQRLLDSIRNQTLYPDEIIIYTSQSTLNDIKDIELPKNASIYCTPNICNTSYTRNKLFQLSTCDVLSFFDADDIMHPQRCEFMFRSIYEGADISICKLTMEELDSTHLEYSGSNIMYSHWNDDYHHGHVTLRRYVMNNVRYNINVTRGEDVIFIKNVLEHGYKCVKVPLILTYYDHIQDTCIIGRLIGGLGNQLFIISKVLYESVRTRRNFKFILDDHVRSQGHHPSKYKKLLKNLQVFDERHEHKSYKEKQWSYYDTREDIDNALVDCKNLVLEGYWQSEKHFPDIRDLMILYLNIRIDRNKYRNNECLIMVRRGDYLKYSNTHNPCDINYYINAMDIMKNKGIDKFYVTSDDIEYCKEYLPQCTILDGDDEDIFIDSCNFKNFIISNSSYHWFASYFAEKINVIAPSKWININGFESIYREDMLILDR